MLFFLLIQAKHFICDYQLQTAFMYSGKRAAKKWLLPLAFHAGTNAGGSFAVIFLLTHSAAAAFGAAVLDFVLHAVTDRLKLKSETAFGKRAALFLDQAAHQATYFLLWTVFL